MLKIGVLGAGHLGKIHLKLLKELSDIYEVVGLYDPDEERAFEVSTDIGVPILESIEDLIGKVDVNHQNNKGYTALMKCVILKPYLIEDIIEYLIVCGANVNIKDNNGETALMMGVKENIKIKMIKILIDNGADVNLKNNNGKTALMMGVNDEIKELLIKSCEDVGTLGKE